MDEIGRSTFERLANDHERVAQILQPLGAQLADQINERWRAQVADILNPVVDAQRAQLAGMLNPVVDAQRAQLAGILKPVVDAQRAQLAGHAKAAFEPLMRSLTQSGTELATVTRLMTQANTDAFSRLAQLGLTDHNMSVDRDDQTSGEIWSAVSEVVTSPQVRDLLRNFDPSSVSDSDAQDARQAAESTARDSTQNEPSLTVRQAVALLSALYLLITAAVAQTYGYNVGAVTDVIGWPLAVLGLYSFLGEIQRRR